jgi:hypothetical protein
MPGDQSASRTMTLFRLFIASGLGRIAGRFQLYEVLDATSQAERLGSLDGINYAQIINAYIRTSSIVLQITICRNLTAFDFALPGKSGSGNILRPMAISKRMLAWDDVPCERANVSEGWRRDVQREP